MFTIASSLLITIIGLVTVWWSFQLLKNRNSTVSVINDGEKLSHSQLEKYIQEYSKSFHNKYWPEVTKMLLHWDKMFDTIVQGSFAEGNTRWFIGGHVNACYNTVDRHAIATPDKIALIYEADHPEEGRAITYADLLSNICQVANWFVQIGLKKGDTVTIYMPVIPEAIFAMLACARLGITHNVVFSGFGPEALAKRITSSNSKVLITANEGLRGGKVIHLKRIVDQALIVCPSIKQVLVYKRTPNDVPWNSAIDQWWSNAISDQPKYIDYDKEVDSNTPLFLLYTSGSTGEPKGIMHSTGGYLTYATYTTQKVFNTEKDDVFGCMADIGWITGHSYVVYGPLSLGLSTVLFESVPLYPTPSRYWDMVEKHKISHLYISPTVIRLLQGRGLKYIEDKDLSTLKSVGSVGEPIHRNTWDWIFDNIGKKRIPILDTYWQTETGGIIIAPPNVDRKPVQSPASLPFYGIEIDMKPIKSNTDMDELGSGCLVVKRPWPGIAIGIINDSQRFYIEYFSKFNDCFAAGDGVRFDGRYCVLTGRIDDVLNISGHRLSSAEIESNIAENSKCMEVSVISESDPITGQSICVFIAVKSEYIGLNPEILRKELNIHLRTKIGPIASIKRLVICSELPKTRSGKILRRVLRYIIDNLQKESSEILNTVKDTIASSNETLLSDIITNAKSPMTCIIGPSSQS